MTQEMTDEEFETQMDSGALADAYAEYIMAKSGGERIICNGETLIRAMEDGYLMDSFKDSVVKP